MISRANILILLSLLLSRPTFGQVGSSPGAFARMGFSARGFAMGNAMTAMRFGDITTYYNPALSPFAEQQTVSASFGILSLDRHLNFLNYVQNAEPTAGISVGIINAGVSGIDGRDNDGVHTEDYSTSENQFFLGFANRFDERVSLGVTIKLYYYDLFDQVSSTTVGFDVGALVVVTDDISVGFAVQDIGSKYSWDTSPIYGQDGARYTDRFPTLYRLGVAYRILNYGIVSLDFETSSQKTTIVRIGSEAYIHEHVTVRAGLDRWDLRDNTTGAKPSLGFGVRRPLGDWTPAVDYVYVFEPFSPSGMHIVTLSARF